MPGKPDFAHYLTKLLSLIKCYTMELSFAHFVYSFKAFFANPIIVSSLTGWLVSQLIKAIVTLVKVREKGFRQVLEALLWRTGGMPSSHAAVVTSMTASVAFHEGLGSNLFAVSLFVAMVVMRDAVGVRRASGLQALALNLLGKSTAEKLGIEFEPVKEIKGHAPLEVLIGGILGIIIAAVYFLFLGYQ